jgi:hypothetical protein
MHRRQFLEKSVAIAGLAASGGCHSREDSSKSSDSATPIGPTTSLVPPARPTPTAKTVEDVIGGKAAVALLREADQVEAFRLKDSEYQETIDKYQQVGDGVPVSPDTAAEFAKLLSSTNSFKLDSAKGCVPVYGVQIRFTKDRQTLDLLFCFACDIFLTYLNGKRVGGEDFDPIRPQIVAIMKSLFPKDDVIQKLRDRGI